MHFIDCHNFTKVNCMALLSLMGPDEGFELPVWYFKFHAHVQGNQLGGIE